MRILWTWPTPPVSWGIDSIPVNFLYPIAGTPLGERRADPVKGLKTLCLLRFLNPRSEIRMAAGA